MVHSSLNNLNVLQNVNVLRTNRIWPDGKTDKRSISTKCTRQRRLAPVEVLAKRRIFGTFGSYNAAAEEGELELNKNLNLNAIFLNVNADIKYSFKYLTSLGRQRSG